MKTKFLSIIALLSLSLTSCNNWLDVNQDPNVATSVQPKLLFGYAITSWAGNRTGGDFYIPLAFQAQTIASGGNYGWGAGDVYDISPYSTGNTWTMYYASAGNNLQLAIREAEAATPANNNAAAQCKVVLAEMMYETTMIWGDIPFSEAWNSSIAYPHFDKQEDVLNGILSMLDEALAEFDPASPLKIADYDLYYNGDINKWIRLANSLKLRVAMAMYDKDPSKGALIASLLSSNNMLSSEADNWSFPFYNTPGKENPKYKILKNYAGGQNLFFYANTTELDYMKADNDPRIPVYFDKGSNADYNGVLTENEADATTASINVNTLYRPDAPELMYTYHELLLLEAEVYARGMGVAQDLSKANQLFHDGVSSALDYWGVSDATFVSNLPDLTTAANPLQEIYKQDWIDLMDRPFEAWTVWRRSGVEGQEFPPLTLPLGAPAGPLMRRWLYPNDELTGNQNAPTVAPVITDKMWFDL